jgi:hypothetical protein
MAFTIKFETEGAAFSEDSGYPESEAVWVLKGLIAKVEDGYRDGKLLDSNGNKIGAWKWTTSETSESSSDSQELSQS